DHQSLWPLGQVLALPMQKTLRLAVEHRARSHLLDEHWHARVLAMIDDAQRVSHFEGADFVAETALAANDDPIEAWLVALVSGRAIAIEHPRLAGEHVVFDVGVILREPHVGQINRAKQWLARETHPRRAVAPFQ